VEASTNHLPQTEIDRGHESTDPAPPYAVLYFPPGVDENRLTVHGESGRPVASAALQAFRSAALTVETCGIKLEWAEWFAEHRPVKLAQSTGYAIDQALIPLRRLLRPPEPEDAEQPDLHTMLGSGADAGVGVSTVDPTMVKAR
jgi:hypothetical protein